MRFKSGYGKMETLLLQPASRRLKATRTRILFETTFCQESVSALKTALSEEAVTKALKRE